MSGIRHRFLSDTAIQVFAIIMMIFERVQGAVERYSSAAVPGIACIATACTRGAQCTGDVTEPGPRAFLGGPASARRQRNAFADVVVIIRDAPEARRGRSCPYPQTSPAGPSP